jgi:hypothetical protein
MPPHADVAQVVERQLPKLEVAGSKPVVRSFYAYSQNSMSTSGLSWWKEVSTTLPFRTREAATSFPSSLSVSDYLQRNQQNVPSVIFGPPWSS